MEEKELKKHCFINKNNILSLIIIFIILLTPTKIFANEKTNIATNENQTSKKTIIIVSATITLIGYFYIVIFNKKDD